MDYSNFKIDGNNLNRIAPLLLEELKVGAFQHLLLKETDKVTVITYDLSGNENRIETTIEQAKKALKNPKLNDIALASMKMKFDFKAD